MRRVEETIAGVGGTATGKFGMGKAECDEVYIIIIRKSLIEAFSKVLVLHHSSNYYNTDCSIDFTDLLYKIENRSTSINNRIY